VRSPLRLVALTAGLAVAASLLPVDAAAQGRRGSRAPAVRSARPVPARPAIRPRVVVRPHYRYYRPYRYGFYRSYPYYWWGAYSWGPYGYWGGSYWGYPYYWGGYGYYRYDVNARLGAARLQVSPRETEVFVDGYFAGVVDDFDGFSQRLRLEPGEHEVTLFLDGHKPLTRKMLFTVGQTLKIQHEMEPIAAGEPAPARPVPAARPASPPSTQAPSATPGRRYGRPAMGRPGPRPVDPADAEPAERGPDEEVVIEPGPPRRGEGPVGPSDERSGPSGTLAIRVQPDDAEVLVDGEPWARSGGERLHIALAPGIHRLEVRKAGHETYVGLVRIRPGVATTLNVALAADDARP
jgi:hypothetical protein